MKVTLKQLFDYCKQNNISVACIGSDVMMKSNDALLQGNEEFEVSDNIFDTIEEAHRRDELRTMQYNHVSELRLLGMKAEDADDDERAIELYAEAIEMGEASPFDLLHAYRHAYDRIFVLLSRARAYEREATYINQLLKHELQDADRERLAARLEKTLKKLNK